MFWCTRKKKSDWTTTTTNSLTLFSIRALVRCAFFFSSLLFVLNGVSSAYHQRETFIYLLESIDFADPLCTNDLNKCVQNTIRMRQSEMQKNAQCKIVVFFFINAISLHYYFTTSTWSLISNCMCEFSPSDYHMIECHAIASIFGSIWFSYHIIYTHV